MAGNKSPLKPAEAAFLVKRRLNELPEEERPRKIQAMCKEVGSEYNLNWKTIKSHLYKRKNLSPRKFKIHNLHQLTGEQRSGLAVWAMSLSISKIPLTEVLLGALGASKFLLSAS